MPDATVTELLAIAKAREGQARAAVELAQKAVDADIAAGQARAVAEAAEKDAVAAAEAIQKAADGVARKAAEQVAEQKRTEARDKATAAAEAAATKNDAVAALQAALAPPAGRTWLSAVAVGLFGLALGVLTSLTTTAGITATLIGLLFTFVGASLLSWFKRDAVSPEDRAAVAGYTGAVGAGLVVGLCFGFALRFVDEMFIRPETVERANRPAKQFRDDVKKQLDGEVDLLKSQLEKLDKEKASPETRQALVETIRRIEDANTKYLASLGNIVVDSKSSPVIIIPPKPVITLQAATPEQRLNAANTAAEALEWDKSPENSGPKLTAAERQALQSFETALRNSDPNVHPSPDVLKVIAELVRRQPTSPLGAQRANTLGTFLKASQP